MTPRPRRGAVAAAALAALAAVAGCGERPTTHHRPGSDHRPVSGTVSTPGPAHEHGGHRTRDVPAAGAPAVRLEVRRDSESGWNVHVIAERFTFTPESVGGAALPGTGHAHLYLDGEKIARMYAPWHHLAPAAVPPGPHTLTVRLSADDHTIWSVGGKPVEASAPIEGEGGGGATAAAKADETITVRIAGGRVSPPPGRVEIAKGRRVRIEVTGDKPDTVHVHGFDIERALTPGTPAVVEFTADRTGLFEVETHDSRLVLTQLVVR
ncbi:hypothetical protein [Bailinhaonella thermotolerans]|uniref:EfeO-type cupredoxin-like domain-containing protein n=1 Tax=Bailinhaonella thermotolerans TaxID=1070861 RepID=A0A3A4BA48_9ACTN|nr:hypothetical protein [Bailinhaonella thermotolerans]RJL34604.1 hypothetical protein D5H75_06055 [Bailinhaonella thermotolerans]